MPLLTKIKTFLGRRPAAQGLDSDRGGHENAEAGRRDELSGLRNSVARGAAEGTFRGLVQEFFDI